jgi:hypothetical protein
MWKIATTTLTLFTPRRHIEIAEVYLHSFFTSALYGHKWSVSGLGRFTSKKRVLGANYTGGWVGTRAGLTF